MNEYTNGEYYNFDSNENIQFNYNSNPSAYALQLFVDKVVSIIADKDFYHPLLRDVIFNFVLINDFSDVDIDKLKDGEIDEIERFVNSNTIAAVIKDSFGTELVDKLNDAIDDVIAYKTGFNPNSLSKGFAKLLMKVNDYVAKTNEEDLDRLMSIINSPDGNLSTDLEDHKKDIQDNDKKVISVLQNGNDKD